LPAWRRYAANRSGNGNAICIKSDSSKQAEHACLEPAQRHSTPQRSNGQLTFPGSTIVQNEDQFMPRVDWITRKNTLSAGTFFTQFGELPQTALASKDLLAMTGSGEKLRVQTLAISDVYTVSPHLLLNTSFGGTRRRAVTLRAQTYYMSDFGVQIARRNT